MKGTGFRDSGWLGQDSGWLGTSLSLAGIFLWILLYPLYGPLLWQTFGPGAYVLGHFFAFSHAAGLIILGLARPWRAQGHRARWGRARLGWVAGAILVLSLAWPYAGPLTPAAGYAVAVALGLLAAELVLSWTPGFVASRRPVWTVALAMILTNVALGLASLLKGPGLPDTLVLVGAVSLGPVMAAWTIGRAGEPDEHRLVSGAPGPAPPRGGARPILVLAAFAAAAYFSGGLWYRSVLPLFYSSWPNLPGIDSYLYAATMAVAAWVVGRRGFGWLGPATLSLLGLGLIISLPDLDPRLAVLGTVVFLSAGLGTADLFYWLALRGLGAVHGPRLAFGLGLGVSVLFLTGSGVALDLGLVTAGKLPSPSGALIGTAIILAVVPLTVWLAPSVEGGRASGGSGETGGSGVAAGDTAASGEASRPSGPLAERLWEDLTLQQRKVLELLLAGRDDAAIAKTLYISGHTVKFHVRNILHKAEVANRKELLALHLKGGPGAGKAS